MTNGTAFSRYTKQKRMDADLSQKDVAEKLGLFFPLNLFRTGKRDYQLRPLRQLKKSQNLSDVSIEELSNLAAAGYSFSK